MTVLSYHTFYISWPVTFALYHVHSRLRQFTFKSPNVRDKIYTRAYNASITVSVCMLSTKRIVALLLFIISRSTRGHRSKTRSILRFSELMRRKRVSGSYIPDRGFTSEEFK